MLKFFARLRRAYFYTLFKTLLPPQNFALPPTCPPKTKILDPRVNANSIRQLDLVPDLQTSGPFCAFVMSATFNGGQKKKFANGCLDQNGSTACL